MIFRGNPTDFSRKFSSKIQKTNSSSRGGSLKIHSDHFFPMYPEKSPKVLGGPGDTSRTRNKGLVRPCDFSIPRKFSFSSQFFGIPRKSNILIFLENSKFRYSSRRCFLLKGKIFLEACERAHQRPQRNQLILELREPNHLCFLISSKYQTMRISIHFSLSERSSVCPVRMKIHQLKTS